MTFFHQLSIKETEANIQLAVPVMASRGMMAAGGNLTGANYNLRPQLEVLLGWSKVRDIMSAFKDKTNI